MAINVTKTFMPPFEEYSTYLKQIWQSDKITNQGPLLQEFESKIIEYTNSKYFHFVANGTLAIQIALRALEIEEGEVITTPFSYVATTSAILWEKLKPVYVDIDSRTLNIDPKKIEDAITPSTKAILAVHVFGNPCDIESINDIAEKHNIKVVYDAAHAFAVTYNGSSIFNYGDISITSFHATKPFHTIEGGGIFTRDKKLSEKIELVKRFGHHGDDHCMLGINAKATEFQAAMGLCNVKYIDNLLNKRKSINELYNVLLKHKFSIQEHTKTSNKNYAYYPIIFDNENALIAAKQRLERLGIYPRRYFYPSLNLLPYIDNTQDCPVSEDISRRILCLPIYPELSEETVRQISEVLLNE